MHALYTPWLFPSSPLTIILVHIHMNFSCWYLETYIPSCCWLIPSFNFWFNAEGNCRSLLYLKNHLFHIVGDNGWDSPPCSWPSHSNGWSSADCESYMIKIYIAMSLGSSVVMRTLSLPLKLHVSMCASMYWKKLEVDLTQDESPQLQNLGPYHLPLLQPLL